MLIDTHAHLDFPDFEGEVASVLERAAAAGVTRVITIGTDLEGSRRAIALAEAHPGLYAAIGIHPNNAQRSLQAEPEAVARLRELAAHPKVVAIGETGLDYYRLPSRKATHNSLTALANEEPVDVELAIRDGAVKSAQSILFEQQLDLAAELGLNIVIHQRGECLEDTLSILAPYDGKVRAVFHCFTGTAEDAARLFARGHLVSFTGIVTFRNAPTIAETAAAIPGDRYMVETDCPFLAPVPYRGKRCEPAHTRQVAEKIAELRGIPVSEVAAATTATAETFFRFGSNG